LICGFLLTNARRGWNGVEIFVESPGDERLKAIMIFIAVWAGIGAYFVRDNLKMREQLRRLESMRREWDEPSGR
jgi:hypothetical protein